MTDLSWIISFNIIINSVLSFFTAAGILWLIAFIFRVKEPRVKALIFCIPFLKLVLDLILYYDISNWALFHSLDPWLAEENSRMLTAYAGLFPYPLPGIHLTMADGKLFTVADVLSLYLGVFWTKIVVCLTFSCSCGAIVAWVLRLTKSCRVVSTLMRKAVPYKEGVALSESVSVPCAVGIFKRQIIFPKSLAQKLSPEEFDAILSHEKNHLFWHDALFRLIGQFLSISFWWIPTKRWLSFIERLQEEACDLKCTNRLHLAGAIVKSAKFEKMTRLEATMTGFVQGPDVVKRVKALLEVQKQEFKLLKWIRLSLVAIAAIAIALGHFWIF